MWAAGSVLSICMRSRSDSRTPNREPVQRVDPARPRQLRPAVQLPAEDGWSRTRWPARSDHRVLAVGADVHHTFMGRLVNAVLIQLLGLNDSFVDLEETL